MANYKETSVTGTAYIRAREVHIDNPLTGPRQIRFVEEKVLNLDGEAATTPAAGLNFLSEQFTPDNAPTTFDLLDASGEPTGSTATYMDVYNILFSLYYHLAQQRDQQEMQP